MWRNFSRVNMCYSYRILPIIAGCFTRQKCKNMGIREKLKGKCLTRFTPLVVSPLRECFFQFFYLFISVMPSCHVSIASMVAIASARVPLAIEAAAHEQHHFGGVDAEHFGNKPKVQAS